MNTGGAGGNGPNTDEEKMLRMFNDISESCPFKGAMSGVVGFAFGGLFGLVMSSFDYTNYALPDEKPPPLRQQLREAARDMGKRSWSSGKNFGLVGLTYATTECAIESYRAKHDIINSASAGCISGAILAHKGGPQAAAFGCASFAAFSSAIDYFVGH